MRYKILLVEDSEDSVLIVQESLGVHHDVTVAKTVDEAVELLGKNSYALILLDLTLPQKDGYALLEKLQADAKTSRLPVICLTGRSEITDKVTAFSMGAEDYLVKPVNKIELRVRVEAKLRKIQSEKERDDLIRVGQLEIDRGLHQAFLISSKDRRALALTPTEFKLLYHLARQPERVYSREQLMQSAWGNDSEVFDRAVDVHISGIRKKLGEFGHYIRAVPGVGYKLSVSKEGD